MTVFVRRSPKGWIEYDIRGTHADGTVYRERRKSHLPTITATERWAQQRETEILAQGPEHARRITPTLSEFWDEYERIHFANGPRGPLKASSRASKASHWRVHIEPVLGKTRLSDISRRVLDEFTASLQAPIARTGKKRSLKTVNDILTSLNSMFARAEAWERARSIPRAKLFRLDHPEIEFWDFDEWERLREAAAKVSTRHLAMYMLGCRAGLRAGEMQGFAPQDVDYKRGCIWVRRSVWRGVEGLPKGGKARRIPVGQDVLAALKAVTPVSTTRLLLRHDGRPVIEDTLRSWAATVELRAGLNDGSVGGLHIMRHTYASHLAMRGVSIRVIKDLLGHTDIKTTMRYAHLMPSSLDAAVTALDEPVQILGDSRETRATK